MAFADQPGVTRIVAVLPGARLQPPALGPLRPAPGPADRAALPPRRLRAPRRVPRQILYDRMKTAVSGEDAQGHIVYNRALVDFARHHGYYPEALLADRAKTKGKVERPYRYILRGLLPRPLVPEP